MNRQSSKLLAQTLAEDPRVQQAKNLLHQVVQEHQQKIQAIRPPVAELKQNYEKLLAQFAECRGSNLWFPYIGSGIGNGVFVELCDGSIKYDFISGIGVHYFGHSHPAIMDAAVEGAISDTIMQGHLQQNQDSVDLCHFLIQISQLNHCFLTTSGAMANENGLKIAFQKRFPAHRILAFEHCFAGRTLALAQITDKPAFREGLPDTIEVDYLPFYDGSDPEGSTERSLSALHHYLQQHPKEYAVMIFELVQGERGFYPGTAQFFAALMKVLKEHDISILVDEVQTFGRTPSLFAFQYFGLESYVDIVTIGKLAHVCATLYRSSHRPRPGLLSQTFTSSTVAIRASLALLRMLLEEGYYGANGKISQLFSYISSKLAKLEKRYPQLISGPFGIGAMVAFTPFDGSAERVTRFVRALFDAGVISFIAGSHPTRVRFLLPIGVVTNEHIDAVLKIVEETLQNE